MRKKQPPFNYESELASYKKEIITLNKKVKQFESRNKQVPKFIKERSSPS